MVVVWNAEWASPQGAKGRAIRRILVEGAPEIVCLTEGFPGLLPEGGFGLEAEGDYGYYNNPGGLKVLLWSASSWREVELRGPEEMPPGRFIAGVTETSAGAVRVAGVCIPWAFAHVSKGRRDRRLWEDHRKFLAELARSSTPTAHPSVDTTALTVTSGCLY